jgi:hypothetical protein
VTDNAKTLLKMTKNEEKKKEINPVECRAEFFLFFDGVLPFGDRRHPKHKVVHLTPTFLFI